MDTYYQRSTQAQSLSMGIQISPAAQAYLDQIRQKAPSQPFLLLTLKKTGCSGFAYDLQQLSSVPENARRAFEKEGLVLYIDEKHEAWLSSLEIDLEVGALGLKKLLFRNPKEAARCGCGESFSVKKE